MTARNDIITALNDIMTVLSNIMTFEQTAQNIISFTLRMPFPSRMPQLSPTFELVSELGTTCTNTNDP